jgi:large subunit ribosomal protein L30
MANLKITLLRSPIGSQEQHKRTVRALGLTKMNKTVIRPDNDAIRGMIKHIFHMIKVEEESA